MHKHNKNLSLKDVVKNESLVDNNNINPAIIGEVVYRETFGTHSEFGEDVTQETEFGEDVGAPQQDTEFGEDVGAPQQEIEFGEDVGAPFVEDSAVTENAPYHNTAKYKMVDPDDADGTVSTHSS